MNLIFLDGSGRAGSYNRQLLEAFERKLRAKGLDFTATYFSPTSHPVPNLVPGLERSAADAVLCDNVRAVAMAAQGFVIASPEYNGGPTGGLKNLIDWMTSPNEAYPKGNPFIMKPTALLSASSGALGGIKGLQVLRLIMGHLRALILPEQVALGACEKAFGEDGEVLPGLAADLLETAVGQMMELLREQEIL